MNKEEIDKKYIRELDVLLKEIRSFSIVIFEHFKTYSDANSIRFVKSSAFLLEHIDQGLLPYLDGFLIAAGQFDFSSQHPANGYRSVVGLIEKCSLHLLTLTRYVALKKKSLLFRNDHYSKEFESYVTLLGQLRACLQYAQKFMSYSSGQLVSEHVSEDEFKIMQEIENLSQEPFYGVCLGFQYNSSMLQTILVMHIILASYSSGYNKSSPFMKLASSVLSSGKFIISPEERAKKVIEATVHGDVNFCKSFWDLSENALLHSIAKVVSPLVTIEKTIHIPLDPPVQVFLSSDPNKHITVSVPNAESSSIMVRLFSHQARQGQTPSATYPLSDGLIVHCHGGGFIAQSSATHSTYLRDWALKTKVPIVSIDYSLAPEFHYPRQVEEIFFAYCWILNNLHIFGSTGSKICFAGDSAGANLATSTVLRTIHEGVRVPDGLLAVYGCFLVSYFPTPSRLLALLDPVLPLGMLPKCVGAYLGIDTSSQKKKDENENQLALLPMLRSLLDKSTNSSPESPTKTDSVYSSADDNLTPPTSSPTHVSSPTHTSSPSSNTHSSIVTPSLLTTHTTVTTAGATTTHTTATTTAISAKPSSSSTTLSLYSPKTANSHVTADEDKQRTVNIASNMDDNKQVTQFSLDYQEEGDAVDNVSTSNSDSHKKFNDRAKVSLGKKSLHDNIKNNGTKSTDSSPDSLSLAEDHKNQNISKNDQTFENKKNSMVYKRKKSSKSLSSTPTTPLKQKSTADFKLYKSLSLYSDVDALYCENIFKQNNVVQVQDYALYRNFTTDYFTELRQKTETNRDPFLSPVFASDELLRGLCPVHFIACKYDPLLDDTIHFARKVKEAGGQVDLHLVDDLPHGFLNFKQFTKESSAASDVCVQSLKCLLNVDECALHVNSISCQDTTISNVSTNATVSNAGNDVSNVGNDVSDVCDVASQQASDVCLGISACDDSVAL